MKNLLLATSIFFMGLFAGCHNGSDNTGTTSPSSSAGNGPTNSTAPTNQSTYTGKTQAWFAANASARRQELLWCYNTEGTAYNFTPTCRAAQDAKVAVAAEASKRTEAHKTKTQAVQHVGISPATFGNVQ